MFRYIFQLLSPFIVASPLPWSNPSLPSLLQQIFSTCCPCFSFSTLDFVLGLQSVSHYHGCQIMATIWQPSPVAFISLSLSLKTLRLMCNQDECKSQFAQSNHIHAWFLVKIISPFILKGILPIAMFCDQCPWALYSLPLIQLSLHLSLRDAPICYSLIICGKVCPGCPSIHSSMSLGHSSFSSLGVLSCCHSFTSKCHSYGALLAVLTPLCHFNIFSLVNFLALIHMCIYLYWNVESMSKKELIDMFIYFSNVLLMANSK